MHLQSIFFFYCLIYWKDPKQILKTLVKSHPLGCKSSNVSFSEIFEYSTLPWFITWKYLVIDVEPFRMMIILFSMKSYSRHKSKSLENPRAVWQTIYLQNETKTASKYLIKILEFKLFGNGIAALDQRPTVRQQWRQ